MNSIKVLATAAAATIAMTAVPAHADKLDDIISSGKLRCAVTLDFPPMGSRDAQNNPQGFDVDTCRDLAKALGVKAEIVETPFPDRIPAIVSGRADVGVAATSDTLERAKSIGFSIPYYAFTDVVLTRKDAGITTFDSLKGHKVGSTAGTYEAIALNNDVKKWSDSKGSFRAFQTQADVFLAISQGQIDASVVTNTVAAAIVKSGKYPNLAIGGAAPYPVDYVNLIATRKEQGLINYLNLFINHQVREGREEELHNKWIGVGKMPNLTAAGVYY
ncbi:amino acid ABC transporter substrate-binding protein [Caballeronia pedi]|uniref:Amino acid ABC transporter substrate-binding protein n=1 Tax=Caballeronia pedi TaxID=1777141 RepID=A0A157ZS35_9BURK|nr:transporter substrate-binding domain-containing protein [Caballeronia pedi]SAK48328.1 amino acid ABC transporter substrate-binding protein [Caballeronia pedi]